MNANYSGMSSSSINNLAAKHIHDDYVKKIRRMMAFKNKKEKKPYRICYTASGSEIVCMTKDDYYSYLAAH